MRSSMLPAPVAAAPLLRAAGGASAGTPVVAPVARQLVGPGRYPDAASPCVAPAAPPRPPALGTGTHPGPAESLAGILSLLIENDHLSGEILDIRAQCDFLRL